MREKTERSGFPKSGDIMNVIRFLCETPPRDRDRVYVGPVKGSPELFNFALFPEPVTPSSEQAKILQAADAVAKLSTYSESSGPGADNELFTDGRTTDGNHTPDAPQTANTSAVGRR